MRNNSTWAPSALSPTVWPPKAWNVSLTVLALVGVAVLNVLPGLVYFIVALEAHVLDRAHIASPPLDHLLTAQMLTFVPLAAYLVIVVPNLARTTLHDLGVRRPTGRELAVGAVGAVVMFLVVSIAGAVVASVVHRHDTEAAVALLHESKSTAEKVAFFAIACVFAPMIEEFEFRVLLFNALTRRVTVPIAAVVSGIVFGLVHAGGVSQLGTIAIPLAAGGIVLAYVYATARNYWSSVITHAAFNSISVIAVFGFHMK